MEILLTHTYRARTIRFLCFQQNEIVMSYSRLNKMRIGRLMIIVSVILFIVALMPVSNFTTFTGDLKPVGPVDLRNLSLVIVPSFAGLGLLVGGSILVSTDKE